MSETDMALRLLLAVACGGLIGLEREWGDRTAGFRTYIMVSLGAALFTALSLYAFPGCDTTRVAAQVVTGIGFLGVGVIVFYGGTHVVGITTAATMWVAAAVGMAAGAGLVLTALYSTGIILAVLIILPLVETKFIDRFRSRRLFFTVRGAASTGMVGEVEEALSGFGVKSTVLSYEHSREGARGCTLLLQARVPAGTDILQVVGTLYGLKDVDAVSFEG